MVSDVFFLDVLNWKSVDIEGISLYFREPLVYHLAGYDFFSAVDDAWPIFLGLVGWLTPEYRWERDAEQMLKTVTMKLYYV